MQHQVCGLLRELRIHRSRHRTVLSAVYHPPDRVLRELLYPTTLSCDFLCVRDTSSSGARLSASGWVGGAYEFPASSSRTSKYARSVLGRGECTCYVGPLEVGRAPCRHGHAALSPQPAVFFIASSIDKIERSGGDGVRRRPATYPYIWRDQGLTLAHSQSCLEISRRSHTSVPSRQILSRKCPGVSPGAPLLRLRPSSETLWDKRVMNTPVT